MTRAENQRIQQIAQQAASMNTPPASTPAWKQDVEFGRAHSAGIWDALFALRAGKPLDHSLPGVPGPRKRDHTIKGVPGEPDDDDTPEPERDPNDDNGDDDDDEADDDDATCTCDCEECRAGRCEDCSNPTCDDPNCGHDNSNDDDSDE